MINIFRSEIAVSQWKCGVTPGTYTPPIRNWGFDPDLLGFGSSFSSHITPFAVYVTRVAWNDNLDSRID